MTNRIAWFLFFLFLLLHLTLLFTIIYKLSIKAPLTPPLVTLSKAKGKCSLRRYWATDLVYRISTIPYPKRRN